MGHSRRTQFRYALGVALAIHFTQGAVAQTFTTLYSFKGNPDGDQPHGGVILSTSGTLYGTTYIGGANLCHNIYGSFGCGTIYELAPAGGSFWTETVLYNFNGVDGALPMSDLVFDSKGDLWGTSAQGGNAGGGTIFELAPPATAGGAWTYKVAFSIGGSYGGTPPGAVLFTPSGALFTTTEASTVLAVGPPPTPGGAWVGSVIYSFAGFLGTPGSMPLAGLVQLHRSLYGTDCTAAIFTAVCSAAVRSTSSPRRRLRAGPGRRLPFISSRERPPTAAARRPS